VARLIGSGYTNKAASKKLGISVNTTGTHLRSVFAKLGVKSRVQLSNVMHEQDTAVHVQADEARESALSAVPGGLPALAASGIPPAVHVFAHGPHSLGLAEGAGDTATWTALAATRIREHAATKG
jgi:Bacterial regulatory proteins, luxR family